MPEIVYVLFYDETHTVIQGSFGGPQDPEMYPNYGTMMTDDAKWHTFYYSVPEWMQFYLPTPV